MLIHFGNFTVIMQDTGLSMWHTAEEPACQCWRCVLDSCWEGPLEKEMTAHSSILAWRIPRTEESGSYSPQGHKEPSTTEQLIHTQTHTGKSQSQT